MNFLGCKRSFENNTNDNNNTNSNNNNNDNINDNNSNANDSSIDEDINGNFMKNISFIDYIKEVFTLDQKELLATQTQSFFSSQSTTLPSLPVPQSKQPKNNLLMQYISPKFDYLCLSEIPLAILLNLYPHRKLNIVLDIDQTLLHSKPLTHLNKNNLPFIKASTTQIEVKANDEICYLFFDIRPHVIEFLTFLKPFTNFFIFTLGQQNYAMQVIEKIIKLTDINIKAQDIIAMTSIEQACAFEKSLHYYKDLDHNNTLILDDSSNKWNSKDRDSLLLSKRFISYNELNLGEFHYVFDDKLIVSNNSFFEDNDMQVPMYIEREEMNHCQLKYLMQFIENVFKLSLIRGEEVVYVYQKLRKRILSKKMINFTYLANGKEVGFLKEMVKYLGGDITMEKGITTHYVISKENIGLFKKNRLTSMQKYNCVNLKWLFHSYFFMMKMNEGLEEYKVVFS